MSYKNKIYLSVFLIVVLAFALIFLGILPTWRGIKEKSRDLAFEQKELASIELLAESFEDFEKNFRFYEEGLEEMENLLSQESLIDPEIPVSFINFFKEQGEAMNLSLKISPIPSQEKKDRFWSHLSFRINGQGEFNDVMRFLEKLENSRWLVETTRLDIVKKEGLEPGSSLSSPASSFSPAQSPSSSAPAQGGGFVEINLLIDVYAQS